MKLSIRDKGNFGKESKEFWVKDFEGKVWFPRKQEKESIICSFRFLAFLALIIVVILGIGIGTAFIYSISFVEVDEGEEGGFWNDRPIIGILAQEYYQDGNYGAPQTSYIAASYIKFIEGGGGRVVPIMINRTEKYYNEIFQGINGILLPGGDVFFNQSGYGSAGKYLLKLARAANDQGEQFPVWGACLGFEFLVYDALGGRDVLVGCNAYNITNKLQFTKEADQSRLFRRAPKRILHLLSTQAVTANFHNQCLTAEVIQKHELDKTFNFLSWSSSEPSASIPYVSAMEHRKYPFYGVQFHPEKNMYEWSGVKNIPHTSEAVLVAQYFAQFFINQARMSRHSFGVEAEWKYLIYNYNVSYTGGTTGSSPFEQKYFFPI